MKDSHYSIISRLLFFVAAILVLVGLWESVLQLFGYTMSWLSYVPGRLIEFAGILTIFLIALLLRQIRDTIRDKQA